MSDPVNPYAAPQVDETMAPGAQWASNVSPSLRQTAIGLSLVYFGIVTVLLCALVLGVGTAIAAGAGAGGGGGGALAMVPIVFIAGIGIFVGAVLMFIGPLLCLAVPSESGAKGLIIGSVVFQVANLVVSIIQPLAPQAIPPAVSSVFALAGMVGLVLFILFMMKLAGYIGRKDLAGSLEGFGPIR